MQGYSDFTTTQSPNTPTHNTTNPDANITDLVTTQTFLHQQNAEFLASIVPTLFYLSFVMVAGLAGNSLVLAVYWTRYSRSVARTHILAISVCALLTVLLSLPAELLEVCYYFTYRAAWGCKFSRTLKSFFSFLAAGILVTVALERHKKMCGPYLKCVPSMTVRGSLVGCVLFSIFISLPFTFLSGPQTVRFPEVNISGFRCSTDDAYSGSVVSHLHNLLMGLTFLTCFCIITLSYIRIAQRLWQHQRHVAAAKKRARAQFVKSVREAERLSVMPLTHIHSQKETTKNMNEGADIPHENTNNEVQGTTHKNAESEIVSLSCESEREEETGSPPLQQQQQHTLTVPQWTRGRCDSVSSEGSSLQPVQVTMETSLDRDSGDTATSLSTRAGKAAILSKVADKRAQTSARESGLWIHPAVARLQACTHFLTARQKPEPKENDVDTPDKNHGGAVPQQEEKKATSKPKVMHQQRKIPTRTTFTMFILTAICVFVNYFPFLMMVSLRGQRETILAVIGKNGYHVCVRSYFVHIVINPLVLCFCSGKFRRECRQFFLERFLN